MTRRMGVPQISKSNEEAVWKFHGELRVLSVDELNSQTIGNDGRNKFAPLWIVLSDLILNNFYDSLFLYYNNDTGNT